MAQQYVLSTDSFAAITETSGTIQNVGVEAVELVSGTNAVAGEGITLRPGERIAFDGAISARSLGDNDAIINVVDFSLAGKGGVNHVYIPKGSVAFANLPTTLTEDMLGWTYNVSDAFTTDSQFVDGAGIAYPAGQNVVVVEASEGVYKYDCFAGAYILPIATEVVLGGVKSSTVSGGVSVDSLGNMTINIPVASESVLGGAKIGTGLSMNSDTLVLGTANESVIGGIKSTTVAGGVSVDSLGNPTINLPTASESVKGGVKLGDSFGVDSDVLILNPAEDTIVGGIKSSTVAGGVSVDSLGNATINLPVASESVLGGVKSSTVIGGVQVDSVGGMTFNLGVADETLLGGVKSSSLDGGVSVDAQGAMTVNQLFYRKANTAYVVGDIVFHNALAVSQKLVCVKAGTTANSALTLSSTDEGAYITDGTAAWVIDSLADGNYSAGHGNGIYRGADITAYWDSGLMSANIAAGKFVGIHIGDFITKSVTLPAITYTNKAGVEQTQAAQTFTNVKWLVAAIDPHIHCGDTETTAHHVLLIPASTLQRNVKMNPTNDTTGAYTGSDMWRVHIPNWASAIKTAFGSGHVLKHRELLANAINATAASGAGAGWVGTASNWAWTDVEVNIPNEQMIYGGRVWGSGFDGGDFPRILPLYALKCSHLDDRSWFWLRAVASASHFALAIYTGNAACTGASYSLSVGGVRPYFLAH